MGRNRTRVGKIDMTEEELMRQSKENPRGFTAKKNKEMGAVAEGGGVG